MNTNSRFVNNRPINRSRPIRTQRRFTFKRNLQGSTPVNNALYKIPYRNYIYPRGFNINYKYPKRPYFINNNLRNKNNNKSDNKKIKQNINNLEKKIDSLAITNTKLVNKYKSKKEMRNDTLINAMNMSKYSHKLPFYKSSLKTLIFDMYNQINLTLPVNKSIYLFWFPYAYPYVPNNVKIWNAQQWIPVNDLATITLYNRTDNEINMVKENLTFISGDNRLIAATMRITNTSPAISKEGSYTMYQSTNNAVTPIAYANNMMNFSLLNDIYKDVVDSNLDLLSNKMLFSSHDVGYIDEYGVRQGNTIFNTSNEYLGNNYTGNIKTENEDPLYPPFARPMNESRVNPTGVNIVYIIKFPSTSTPQHYIIETWGIWDVIPSEESTLGTIAQLTTRTFNDKVIEAASHNFPFHK